MDYTFYAYWNGEQIYDILNAIVLVTGGASGNAYRQLMISVALIAFMVSIGVGLAKLRATDTVTAFMALTFFYGIFFVPTKTVLIDDVRNSQQYVVANVPLGLALFGSMTSQIGYFLTNAYETSFTAVDDEKFSKTGFLFGSRLIEELPNQQYSNPVLRANLNEFSIHCILPELVDYPSKLKGITAAPDVWAHIAAAGWINPGRVAPYVNETTGVSSILDCEQATTALGLDALAGADRQLKYLSDKLHPGGGVSQATMAGQLSAFETVALGISRTADQTIRHYAMVNVLRDSANNNAAGTVAATFAAKQLETSYFTMKTIAEGALPKLRNLIEALIYAVFPIVFLLVIAAGAMGGKVLSMYAMAGVWIHLWAPLYAVINSFMFRASKNSMLQVANSGGGTIENMPHLIQMTVSDHGMAGLLVLSVPAIALAIVKGGAVAMSGVVNSLMSPAQSTAARTGSELGMGNVSGANVKWGDVSMGNSNMRNATHDQVRTAPTSYTGSGSNTVRGDDGSEVTTHANGSQAVNRAPAASNLGPVGASAGAALSQAAGEGSRNQYQAAAEAGGAFATRLNAAFETAKSHTQSSATATGVSSNASIGDMAKFNRMSSEMEQTASKWNSGHGLDTADKRQILTEAAAQVRAGVGGNIPGTEIGASAGLTARLARQGINSAELKELMGSAREYAQSSGFTEQVARAQEFGAGLSTTTGNTSTDQAARGIKAALTDSSEAQRKVSSSLSQAKGYEEFARQEESGGTQSKRDLANYILDQMGGGNRAEANAILGQMDEAHQHAMVAAYARAYAHDQASLLAPGDPSANEGVKTTAQGVTPTPGQPDDVAFDGADSVRAANTGDKREVPGNPDAPPAISVDGKTVTPQTVSGAVDGASTAADLSVNSMKDNAGAGEATVQTPVEKTLENPGLSGRTSEAFANKVENEVPPAAQDRASGVMDYGHGWTGSTRPLASAAFAAAEVVKARLNTRDGE